MTNKTFVKIFFISILLIMAGYLSLICIVNPQQTAPFSLSHQFDQSHDNFLLRKTQLMAKGEFETLIVGSSTSEAFSVQEINHAFNTTTFHASIGGGNTASRYVLFKKALKNFPNLKRVIYVADFFEFNQARAPQILAFNSELALEVENKSVMPSKIDYLKYLFSHQLIESVFTVIKRQQKGYISPLLPDGTTTTSMILSTVQTQESFNTKITPENKTKLMEEILENNQTYSRSVLANFKELDPGVKTLYLSLVKAAAEKNIEVMFILSPYHYEFKKMLFENKETVARYSEWIEFMNSLKNEKGVVVYNALESAIATDPESAVWRDGIHFNNYAAAYFVNVLKEESQHD